MANFEFRDNSPAVLAQMERNIGKALTMMGIRNLEIATKEMNVLIYDTPPSPSYDRTGHLRRSQGYNPPDIPNRSVTVGNSAEYAPYVHEGTTRTPARPWLRNSVLNYIDEYKNIAGAALGEGFK